MTTDEAPRSLADAAAAWIPPWARTPEPPVEPEGLVEPWSGSPEASVEPEIESVAEAESVAELEAEPSVVDSASESVAEAESVAEPDASVGAQPAAVSAAQPALRSHDRDLRMDSAVQLYDSRTDRDLADVAGLPVDESAQAPAVPDAEQLHDRDFGTDSAAPLHDSRQDSDLEDPDVEAPESGPVLQDATDTQSLTDTHLLESHVLESHADSRQPAPTPEPARELQLIPDSELRGALEAILLVVEEPVSEIMLAQVLEQPTERITTLLATLTGEYTEADRGFELRRAAGGWRLYTRPRYAPYVEKFVLDGQQSRLTQAALETLAVVAYKQPVTRSRISAIRGVNCDGVVRTLVARGLIEECGSEPDSGAFLYRTTTLFLEKLGLDSVAQLPELAPFLPDDVDEIADAQR